MYVHVLLVCSILGGQKRVLDPLAVLSSMQIWEMNWGPLKEQPMLFIAELFL